MTRMTNKKTLQDVDVAGKTVLVRVDFNVPFQPGTTEISDGSRIRASLPTIRFLVEQQCKVLICSHLGRPNGNVVEKLRMVHVTRRLAQLLDGPVTQASDNLGPEVRRRAESLVPGGILVLENLRFNPGEEASDLAFAEGLASLAELYVNDAFGTAHRSHASIVGVPRFLPAVAGFLMARELELLGQALEEPKRPFAAIMGGAKVSDKIHAIENLAGTVNILLLGGGLATAFLKAKGLEVGASPVDDAEAGFAGDFLRTLRQTGVKLLLPEDVVIADSFFGAADHRTVDISDVEPGWHIMDIGPRTVSLYEEALKPCKTVVWNGPLGVFEWVPFGRGTARIAHVLADMTEATTVVGGGSTAEAVDQLYVAERMTHVSTGGGATLEFLEGKVLPGVACLMEKDAPFLVLR